MATDKLLAAILIRGTIGARQDIKDTIKMLKIHRKNYCAVFPDTPIHKGMMRKAKDYITFGEIDAETYNLLEEKRGKKKGFYALQPPRGGFERRGVKQPFTKKGALGYRGAKMNDLIKKMI